MQIYTLSSLY